MQSPITIKIIEEKAKELKLSIVAYWISKASKIELNDKYGLCVLIYLKESCYENMKPYLKHAGIILTSIVGKEIEVKAICTGYKDLTCK